VRIAVLTDSHGNLPALQAALAHIRQEGYDLLVHTGDTIAIGPFPAECLALLIETPRVLCLMGNHESCYVKGIGPETDLRDEGERRHQIWTHAQLGLALRGQVANWPRIVERRWDGLRMVFVHYALEPGGQRYAPVERERSAANMARLFAALDAEAIFYGHDHMQSDVVGKARYVNPGSLGCFVRAEARYCIVDIRDGQMTVIQHRVPYDDAPLAKAFVQRDVPDRVFIVRTFFGGRFAVF